MRRVIVTMALVVLSASQVTSASQALAQSGSGGGSAGATSQSQSTREAPVGHRQPRVGELSAARNPSDPNDPLSKENALLDKKIKSICRGC